MLKEWMMHKTTHHMSTVKNVIVVVVTRRKIIINSTRAPVEVARYLHTNIVKMFLNTFFFSFFSSSFLFTFVKNCEMNISKSCAVSPFATFFFHYHIFSSHFPHPLQIFRQWTKQNKKKIRKYALSQIENHHIEAKMKQKPFRFKHTHTHSCSSTGENQQNWNASFNRNKF